jgi:hypothetical protein
VSIPPGGKTDALVETVINGTTTDGSSDRGLDADQNESAIRPQKKC